MDKPFTPEDKKRYAEEIFESLHRYHIRQQDLVNDAHAYRRVFAEAADQYQPTEEEKNRWASQMQNSEPCRSMSEMAPPGLDELLERVGWFLTILGISVLVSAILAAITFVSGVFWIVNALVNFMVAHS